jgi:hypothetical protein
VVVTRNPSRPGSGCLAHPGSDLADQHAAGELVGVDQSADPRAAGVTASDLAGDVGLR